MLTALLAAVDPSGSTDVFVWARAIGSLGGTAMLAIGTWAWFKRLIVTAGELRREQEARAQDRLDFLALIATKDLQLAAKDDVIERKDDQIAAAMKTLVDDTVPALVKATVVMEHQQAELRARRPR